MKILFELGHPAHVHTFKYIIRNIQNNGEETKICIREREKIVGNLLENYDFEYEHLEKNALRLYNKAISILRNDYKLLKIAKKFKPDIFISPTTPYSAQVSKILRKSCIGFLDSEPARLILSATIPFIDVVITPKNFRRRLPKSKHICIDGYKELAYLHPNWFKPNPDILDILSVSRNEKYVILRFSAFSASHDVGIKGFSLDDKRRLVKELEKYARIFISSEAKLPDDLEQYAIKIPPHRMHDALYYASLLVGDTQTSTTESACLGTPAIRCNSFVGLNDMSNFIELEQKYELIFNYIEPKKAIEKVIELIQQPNLKQEWRKKREKLLRDKIDVTAFMTWFIENYPESFQIMKENPKYQGRFK